MEVCEVKLTLLLVNFMLFLEGIGAVLTNVTDVNGTTVTFKPNDIKELRVPKCCDLDEIIIDGNCTKITEKIEFAYQVYDSNETHINDDKYIRNLSVFQRNIECPESTFKIGFYEEDIYGFIYNSSVIYINTNTRTVDMLSPEQYCMEYVDLNRTIVFIHCVQRPPNSAMVILPKLYLSFLILSALCFFGTAGFYYWIMSKENEHKIKREVHKKCFFGYSFSMGVTFCFLFVLQIVNTSCDVFGSLFFFAIQCSFVWITALCIDVVVVVKYFKEEQKDLFFWFAAASIIYPMIFFGLLVFPNVLIDIPNSFIKHYTTDEMCTFPGQKLYIFFIPLAVCIIISTTCLSYAYFLIRGYKENFKNDVDWLMNKAVFKYTLHSCTFICVMSTIWIVIAILTMKVSITNGIIFDVIAALQGCFTVFLLVCNKYIREIAFSYKMKGELTFSDLSQFSDLCSTPAVDSNNELMPKFPSN